MEFLAASLRYVICTLTDSLLRLDKKGYPQYPHYPQPCITIIPGLKAAKCSLNGLMGHMRTCPLH